MGDRRRPLRRARRRSVLDGQVRPSGAAALTRAPFAQSRRQFLRASAGAAALLSGCATSARAPGESIELDARAGAPGDRAIAPLLPYNATFVGHMRRIGGGGDAASIGQAGIDYAPYPGAAQTLVCPAAGGVVIGHRDQHNMSGMVLTIAHGLGWKTQYGHLQARFVGYGTGRVSRGDVIAIMGATGTGATRGGTQGPLYHVHFNLWGPDYTPLFRDLIVQPWPNGTPGYRYLVDGEDFSLGGRATPLRFRRPEDDTLDAAFVAAHDAAVALCDDLLDRLGDAEAERAKQRERWERECSFAYNVDLRMWLLWQRLGGTRHPFDAAQAARHRADLRALMATTPRLTAPIVEVPRRAEYNTRRARPLKVYESQREFGGR